MRQANEGNGSPAAASGVNPNLRHMAGLSHVALCSGPFQLAFFLAALDVCGIPPSQCTVLPFPGSARNDDLKKTLVKACSMLDIHTVDPVCLPTPALIDAHYRYTHTTADDRVAYWYCVGAPYWPTALHYLQKTMPDYVFEYYDGLGSSSVAFNQEKMRLCLADAHTVGDLRQLAVQRLIRPDMHLMPDDGMWQKCAPPQAQAKTRYVSSSVMLRSIRLMGEVLHAISDDSWTLGNGPEIVLLPTRFAETIGKGKTDYRDMELGMHNDLLRAIRSASRTASLLVKAHPRTGAETVRRLQDICMKHDAQLYAGQQLIEYMIDRSRRRNVTVIGYPSTALLNTTLFGWGQSLCLSARFIESYLGHFKRDERFLTNFDLLVETPVTFVDSLADLSECLTKRLPG